MKFLQTIILTTFSILSLVGCGQKTLETTSSSDVATKSSQNTSETTSSSDVATKNISEGLSINDTADFLNGILDNLGYSSNGRQEKALMFSASTNGIVQYKGSFFYKNKTQTTPNQDETRLYKFSAKDIDAGLVNIESRTYAHQLIIPCTNGIKCITFTRNGYSNYGKSKYDNTEAKAKQLVLPFKPFKSSEAERFKKAFIHYITLSGGQKSDS